MSEEVLVVPRDELFATGETAPDGFCAGSGAPYVDRAARRGRFVPRDRAERDPGLKQIIPYAVVTYGDSVFLMRRTRRGAEERLHDRWSVGVGGHINPADRQSAGMSGAPMPSQGGAELLENALLRELSEELVVDCPYSYEVVGVLNDDSDPVGQVHLGVVYRISTAEPRVRVREVGQLEGSFVSVSRLGCHLEAMESWSRHLVTYFWPGVVGGRRSSDRMGN